MTPSWWVDLRSVRPIEAVIIKGPNTGTRPVPGNPRPETEKILKSNFNLVWNSWFIIILYIIFWLYDIFTWQGNIICRAEIFFFYKQLKNPNQNKQIPTCRWRPSHSVAKPFFQIGSLYYSEFKKQLAQPLVFIYLSLFSGLQNISITILRTEPRFGPAKSGSSEVPCYYQTEISGSIITSCGQNAIGRSA